VLDDNDADERKLGIDAGFVWKHMPGVKTVFYVDYGISSGMRLALDYCKNNNIDYEMRELF